MMKPNKLYLGTSSSLTWAWHALCRPQIRAFRQRAKSTLIIKGTCKCVFEAKKHNYVNFVNQSPRKITVEKLGSLNNIQGGEGLGHKKRISRNWRGIDFTNTIFNKLTDVIVRYLKKSYLQMSKSINLDDWMSSSNSHITFLSPIKLQQVALSWDDCRSNKLLIFNS